MSRLYSPCLIVHVQAPLLIVVIMLSPVSTSRQIRMGLKDVLLWVPVLVKRGSIAMSSWPYKAPKMVEHFVVREWAYICFDCVTVLSNVY